MVNVLVKRVFFFFRSKLRWYMLTNLPIKMLTYHNGESVTFTGNGKKSG